MPDNPQDRPSPKPLALVICDNASCDSATGKFSLLGTFDLFSAAAFPAAIKLGVYVVLTDCRGKHSLQLKLIFAGEQADDEDVVGIGIEIEAKDPLETVQFSSEFIGPIAKPGVYYLQLCDELNGCLIERRLVAKQITPPQQGPSA